MDSIERLKLLIYTERDECIISQSLSIVVGEKYERIFQSLVGRKACIEPPTDRPFVCTQNWESEMSKTPS
jgi:hypothetical protein